MLTASPAASPSVRQPNDCCPRKRHVWGTRQSRWLRTAGGFAVSELQPFCAGYHFVEHRFAVRCVCVLACKADGFTSPIRPKDAKLRPRLPKGRGFLFWARLALKICLKICVEAEGAGGRVIKKHNSAFVKVRYSRGD